MLGLSIIDEDVYAEREKLNGSGSGLFLGG